MFNNHSMLENTKTILHSKIRKVNILHVVCFEVSKYYKFVLQFIVVGNKVEKNIE